MKHEVKVLLQFLLISVVWACHVGLYRSIQFQIIQMEAWYIMTISEVNRYIFFCIDPIVYCAFIQEVRDIVLGKFRKNNGIQPSVNNNAWTKSGGTPHSKNGGAKGPNKEMNVEDVL